MRVGIITIIDYNNYGNRLQNYAVQEVLKSIGCEPVTIVNTPNRKLGISDIFYKLTNQNQQRLLKKCLRIYNKTKQKLYMNTKEKKHLDIKEKRLKAFMEFNKNYIIETDYVINQDNIPSNLDKQYDYFVVGSDQVWNPNFRMNSSIDFLTFAPKNKRISFSASFGISKIPKVYIKDYKLRLNEMEHISVREDDGARIVKEVSGREAPILVDPTLLINKEKWISLFKNMKNKPNKPYLLTYVLGDMNSEDIEKIHSIAKSQNLEIVNLMDIKDEIRYVVDPAGFLDYINSSTVFITDSFHGVVFSILLEKPFIVFESKNRKSMNSRMVTLLSKFKFEDRKWEEIREIDNILNINFSHMPSLLEDERKKSLDYLKNALNIKEEN